MAGRVKNYVVARDYRQAREFADENGWTERRNDKREQWIYANAAKLQGRQFEEGDYVYVLHGADEVSGYQETIADLRQMDILSIYSPVWMHYHVWDLPRTGEDLEVWLAR